MSNEVIIDGVNVAECSLYNNGKCLNFWNSETKEYDKCNSYCDYGAYYRQEQLQRAKAELEQSKNYAELLKANRCQHHVLNECSQEHHDNCVGKKQCILDLEQIISNLKAENEELKKEKYQNYKNIMTDSAINLQLSNMQNEINKLYAENDTLHITISKQKEDLSQAETSLYAWKAENEKLKEKINSCNDEFGCEEMVKYRKALKEVVKYCNECNLKADYTACEVLRIIDEVLK